MNLNTQICSGLCLWLLLELKSLAASNSFSPVGSPIFFPVNSRWPR